MKKIIYTYNMRKMTIMLVFAILFVSCTNKTENTAVSNTDSTYVDSSVDAKVANSVDSIFAVDSIK